MTTLCRCVNVQVGTFTHVVLMKPPHVPNLVGIDVCIATEVAELWHLGFRTVASCCGHGRFPPSVSVVPEDHRFMRDLGYLHEPEVAYDPAVHVDGLLPLRWWLPRGASPQGRLDVRS